MSDFINDFENQVKQFSDVELIKMLEEKSDNYPAKALKIAREEARKRGGLQFLKEKLGGIQPAANEQNREASAEEEIDPLLLQAFQNELESNQNLVLGIIGGVVAATIGAILWAVITVIIGYQIGFMAVGVGFLVGYAVRISGKGISTIYGIIGAVLSFAGCLVGNVLSVCAFVSQQENIPLFDILQKLDLDVIIELMIATFSPIDVVFYGIAIYEGYKLSFRKITTEELEKLKRIGG